MLGLVGKLVVVAGAGGMLSGGCARSAEERREAARATLEAERVASEASISSACMDVASSGDAWVAAAEHAAIRVQRHSYRRMLEAALDALEQRRAEASRRGAAYLRALEGRRDVLKSHLTALDRTNDREWAASKARIDRDLQTQSAIAGMDRR